MSSKSSSEDRTFEMLRATGECQLA
jgi:hypothetical protein